MTFSTGTGHDSLQMSLTAVAVDERQLKATCLGGRDIDSRGIDVE